MLWAWMRCGWSEMIADLTANDASYVRYSRDVNGKKLGVVSLRSSWCNVVNLQSGRHFSSHPVPS